MSIYVDLHYILFLIANPRYVSGTAIPGPHWVLISFPRKASATRIVLDWEAAYATAYWLEGRLGDACWIYLI